MTSEQLEIAFTQRPVGLGTGALSMLADAVSVLGYMLFHGDSGWFAAGADAQPITPIYSDPVLVLIALDLKIGPESTPLQLALSADSAIERAIEE